ncbi:MAG TPA: thiazole synthase, partial [Candidatus Sumerlaeota bacterium]|nr:thiazole synthase [Candidatus Sumerlaeota bacterium]
MATQASRNGAGATCTGSTLADAPLVVGPYTLNSRMIVGTGKFENFDIMRAAHRVSESDMVTVALRRVDLKNPDNNILRFIDTQQMTILPNTAGCYSVAEALQVAELILELDLPKLIKVEVIGD